MHNFDLKPVWVHGDVFPRNIIAKDKKIKAIIDFGNMCTGDPACDLALTWSFFDIESSRLFKEKLNLDLSTWNRAKGWALWKALINIVDLPNGTEEFTSLETEIKRIIDD